MFHHQAKGETVIIIGGIDFPDWQQQQQQQQQQQKRRLVRTCGVVPTKKNQKKKQEKETVKYFSNVLREWLVRRPAPVLQKADPVARGSASRSLTC